MAEIPASTESSPVNQLRVRRTDINHRAAAPICNGSPRNKVVRFGSLEPAQVTILKQCTLPLVAVLTLAICTLIRSHSWSLELSGLGLVTFLISAQIFSPLDLGKRPGTEGAYKLVSR